MTNDLIQYLIKEAAELLDGAVSGETAERRIDEAEELTSLATRLLERRELTDATIEYREAA